MKREHIQLLNLINAAIWGKEADASLFDRNTDWNAIYQTAKEQTSLGLTYQGLTTLPNELKPTTALRLKWYGYVADMELQYQHHLNTLETLYQLFEKEKPILMKGLSMAALYPAPHLRQVGDIDLLFPNTDKKLVIQLLKKKKIDAAHPAASKHTGILLNNVEVETHWNLDHPFNPFCKKAYQNIERQSSKICRRVKIGNTDAYLLPLEFCAIYLLIHQNHHLINSGIGLRQLCDWALFLNTYHSKMDKNLLLEMLTSLRMMRAWQLYACFCSEYLELSKDAAIFYNEKEKNNAAKLAEIVFSFGNFGRYNPIWQNRPHSYIKRKIESLNGNLTHFRKVFAIAPSDALYNILLHYPAAALSRLKEGR